MTLNVDQYAIHGTNNPSSIGTVSFGCIRMHNRDILDLYKRVKSRHARRRVAVMEGALPAAIDITHDADPPKLRSFSQRPSRFSPLQNLPLGIFGPPGAEPASGRGDRGRYHPRPCRPPPGSGAVRCPRRRRPPRPWPGTSLYEFMNCAALARKALRARFELLDESSQARPQLETMLHDAARLHHAYLPAASATTRTSTRRSITRRNVGSMFRPDNPLLPNYKYVPIGYHGRASSIVAQRHAGAATGGTDARRRRGSAAVRPTRRLDYELELGVFVGPGNALGAPIPIARREEHIFGSVW